MRISVNKNDAGFILDPYAYTVFLDSERLHNCTMADDEKGEVDVLLDCGCKQTLRGKVRIVRDGG